MFERFTEAARQVVVLAQDEARTLKHNFIGTEHILLGVLGQGDPVAADALDSLGVRIEDVRGQVSRIVGHGDEVTDGQIPFTPRAKKVLELALREGIVLGHNHIAPGHILLGLVRENGGVASRILLDYGADAERVRSEVLRKLGTTPPPNYERDMARARSGDLAETLLLSAPARGLLASGVALGFGILIGWLIWG